MLAVVAVVAASTLARSLPALAVPSTGGLWRQQACFATTSASAPENTVAVIGHKIPDTDAICAAIIRSEELQLGGVNAVPYRLGDLNPETQFVLDAFDVPVPDLLPGLSAQSFAGVAIVDTNNAKELPSDINDARLHSIVDHHMLTGTLQTSNPIEVDIRPIGSSGTILFERFRAQGLPISPKTAALMLSCLLSDTLVLESVTTTDVDRAAAPLLAELAGVDFVAHGTAMLEAKSSIAHLSAHDIVLLDSKVYTIENRKTRISVVETVLPDTVIAREKELLEQIRVVEREEGLDECLLFVVDVRRNCATFVTDSPDQAARIEDRFVAAGVATSRPRNQTTESNGEGSALAGAPIHVLLDGVLSRKKQIIPALDV